MNNESKPQTKDQSSTIVQDISESQPCSKPIVTCWLDFNDEVPKPEQKIYALDSFGQIEEATYEGDWQKKYWTTYDYRWTTRPACR